MYALGAGSRAALKFSEVKRLCKHHFVVFLQEAHGCPGDLLTLEHEVGTHRAFGSFSSSPGVGGVVVLVHKHIMGDAAMVVSSTIATARCIEVSIVYNDTMLQLINVHVDPAAPFREKELLYVDVAAACTSSSDGLCIMGGDFNHQPLGEHRFNLQNGRDIQYYEAIAHTFDRLFCAFTELHQPNFTRVKMEGNLCASASRLDRMYTNIQPIDLMDSMPKICTVHDVFKQNRLSDHSAVSAVLSPPSLTPPNFTTIPTWIIKHSEFQPLTNVNLHIAGATTNPYENLDRLKQAMFGAMEDIKLLCQQQRVPSSVSEKLYWTTLLWRAVRSGNAATAVKAATAYPYLNNFYSTENYLITNTNGLSYHINELAAQDIQLELEELQAMAIPATSKNSAIDRLLARQKLSKSSGKSLVLSGIYNSEGKAATGDEAAHLLAEHWGQVFDVQDGDPEAYLQLADYVQEAKNLGHWQCSLLDVEEMLPRLRATAPGPDGVRYLAYSVTAATSAPMLHDVYQAIIGGIPP